MYRARIKRFVSPTGILLSAALHGIPYCDAMKAGVDYGFEWVEMDIALEHLVNTGNVEIDDSGRMRISQKAHRFTRDLAKGADRHIEWVKA